MSVRTTIVLQIETVAIEQDRKLAPLSDDLTLLKWGLGTRFALRFLSRVSKMPWVSIPSLHRRTFTIRRPWENSSDSTKAPIHRSRCFYPWPRGVSLLSFCN